MALASDTRIYNALFRLSVDLFDKTRCFPKDVKPSIGRRIEETLLDMADMVVYANMYEGTERLRYIDALRVRYEKLQFLINLAVSNKHISISGQADISVAMSKIGRQITGWRKYTEKCMIADTTIGVH
jgi:hypothetical protein